jgi:alpha-D-xyloside xylohydrolase
MGFFSEENHFLAWQENQQKLWVRPWGKDGLRVQANLAGHPLDIPNALPDNNTEVSFEAVIEIGEENAVIRNGLIQATINKNGRICFVNSLNGETLLEEPDFKYFAPPSRNFKYRDGGLFEVEAWFKGQKGERFFGLGQHQHGLLDQKGCVIELQQRNTEISIPFLVSNRKYGFLWNNPAVGRVELGNNNTRWQAQGSRQIDYLIICGNTYTEILERYAEATGKAPALPEWAAGFWQSRLRYETQEELLSVAREYKRRGIPLAVIVADFFHWTHMGDWKFDPACWPDPKAMVRELEEMGTKLMVSVWPTVTPLSENYQFMTEHGMLINNERGVDAQHVFIDNGVEGPAYFAYCDATNPQARKFEWEIIKKNYYDQGVKLFWLDNDEPDVNPWTPENLRFYLGNGLEVANIYPLLHQQSFYEGLQSEGETEIITLSRSAWAGSQRYGSVIWSGDIDSTFESLQSQVRAGLNIAMSGIPWWTTDIGGFEGGDITSASFRELIVRWFQFAVFCPIFRLHGYRMPIRAPYPKGGADNEIWSFGEQVYAIARDLLFLRERLRPYIYEHMQIASEQGLPMMRPLMVDFEKDIVCETIDDQFMFGPEIMAAPVLLEGARTRKVYLPKGTEWVDAWNGIVYAGGVWMEVDAPLDRIPVFLKKGSNLLSVFQTKSI